jgi:hypothetical protein
VLERSAGLSSCICILLSWDESRQTFIDHLKALGIPVLVLVLAASGYGPTFDSTPGIQKNFHTIEAGNVQQGLLRL